MRKFYTIIVLLMMILASVTPAAIANSEGTQIEPTIEIYWENVSQGKYSDDPIVVGDSFNLIVKAKNVLNLYGYGINFFYDSEVLSPVDKEAPFEKSVSELIFPNRTADSISPVNKVTTFPVDGENYGNLAGKTAAIYLDFLSGNQEGVSIKDGVIAKGTFVAKGPIEFTPRVSDRLEDVGAPEESPINVVVQLANDSEFDDNAAAYTQAIPYKVNQAETLQVIELALNTEVEVQGTLSQNGQDLSGVTFSAHTTDGSNLWYDTTTDGNGKFKFLLPDGNYQIDGIWIEEQHKWYKLEKQFTVSNGTAEELTIELPVLNPDSLQGSVRKGSSSVPNVWVSIHTTDGTNIWYDSKVDGSGNFQVILPDGHYQIDGIWVDAEQTWYELDQTFSVVDGGIDGSNELLISLSDSPDVPDFNTTGKVEIGTEPISGIWVSAHTIGENQVWYDSLTEGNGSFHFNLPEGEYQIDGIWVDSEAKWYPLNKRFTAGEGLDTLTIDLAGTSQKLIQGNVKKGNEAIGNVTFSFRTVSEPNVWYDVQTNAEGNFEVLGLQDGDYVIEGIWLDSEQKWYALEQQFSVVNGDIKGGVTIDLAEQDSPVKQTVQGELRIDDKVLPGEWVSIYDSDTRWYDAFTDENGSFVFDLLADGTYQIEGVWVEAEQKWYPLQQSFSVTNGLVNGKSDFVIDLSKSGIVTGNVQGTLLKESEPLKNVMFSVHSVGGDVEWYDTQTNNNGNFSLDLPDGIYQIDGIWLDSEAKWYPLNKQFEIVNGLFSGEESLIVDINNPVH